MQQLFASTDSFQQLIVAANEYAQQLTSIFPLVFTYYSVNCFASLQLINSFSSLQLINICYQLCLSSCSTRCFDLTPRVQTRSNSHQLRELLDSTPALGCVNHFFYASVRKATDTEFYVFVLGRDLVLHFGFDSLTIQFCTSLMNVILSCSVFMQQLFASTDSFQQLIVAANEYAQQLTSIFPLVFTYYSVNCFASLQLINSFSSLQLINICYQLFPFFICSFTTTACSSTEYIILQQLMFLNTTANS
ncbi:putative receptor-like protein kinase [Dorcoceras hygrometricum]|uniref:Putative receptor-like protein kinase n=1 Tax=Dorcoceras hygrometricum TaxID=472368 RepID=A0A2Z7AKT4_9LAMI|nr:putative receptor-like protein kinase [Dorcoceras hygrometricum]